MARPLFAEFVQDAFQRGKLILMDGPMGTELQQSGLQLDQDLSYTWNLTHPNSVLAVHEDYANAGADCLLTNTFSAHVGVLRGDSNWNLAVEKAIELARQAEWDHLYAIGSVGSAVGPEEEALSSVKQLLQSLSDCDAELLETQTRLDRTRQLFNEWKQDRPRCPLMVSFSFSRLTGEEQPWIVETVQGELRYAADVGRWANDQGNSVFALGVNCGQNLRLMDFLTIIQEFRRNTSQPLLLRPGITPTIECEFTPREFAERVRDFADAGVTLIGGCCGTRPAHIAALRREIDRLGLGWNEE